MARKTRQERRFLRRLKRRDEAAFTELVERYKTMVYAVVWRMLRDSEDAEDVAQDVFVAVFKNLDSFREDSSLRTWIYRIALNHARNRLRTRARGGWALRQSVDQHPGILERTISATAQNGTDPVRSAEHNERVQILERALGALSDATRNILILRDIEGHTYAEIATLLDVNEGVVKSRIYRARAALRTQIEHHNEDEHDAP